MKKQECLKLEDKIKLNYYTKNIEDLNSGMRKFIEMEEFDYVDVYLKLMNENILNIKKVLK